MSEAIGISITNMCYQCQALTELCPDCQELKDSRDIVVAHQIVDEGNLQYKHIWSQAESDVTGHDWIGSVTKISNRTTKVKVTGEWNDEKVIVEDIDGDYRNEFLDPISVLTDRIFDLETSLIVTDNEVICPSCHLTHNKAIDCPVCY